MGSLVPQETKFNPSHLRKREREREKEKEKGKEIPFLAIIAAGKPNNKIG